MLNIPWHYGLALTLKSITLALPCNLHSICLSANLVFSTTLSYTQRLEIHRISVSWELSSKCLAPAHSRICTLHCISVETSELMRRVKLYNTRPCFRCLSLVTADSHRVEAGRSECPSKWGVGIPAGTCHT